MDHSATYLDSNDDEGSIWPWVVGLLALLGMLFAAAETVNAIPKSLATNVQRTLSAQNVSGVTVAVDGRDITLTGTLDPSVDKRSLIESVFDTKGVRQVSDSLKVYDPVAAAAQRAAQFEQALGVIDISQLAFEQGSASLTATSRPVLDQLTQLLLTYPEQRIRVSGHTDNTGRPAVNLRISRERAQTVAGYLISRGATTSQVVARGFGASRPIADNSSEAGRARNRRIEITYIK